MANTSLPFASVFNSGSSSPAPVRTPFARRRRIFIGLLLIAVIGFAALTNYGPLRAYHASRVRLQAATAQLKTLEQKRDQMQVELGKLNEADYLESLARQELTYARPGEEVYVTTGSGDGTGTASGSTDLSSAGATTAGSGAAATDASSSAGTEKPGLLERILSAIGRLF